MDLGRAVVTAASIFDVLDDGRYVATELARGPWNPGEAHGGAPAALIAGAVDALEGDLAVTRLTLDFLGAVPIGVPLSLDVALLKPGKRFQLVEAVLKTEERELIRAQAVRIRRAETDAPSSPGPAVPPGRGDYGEHPGLVTDDVVERPVGFFPDVMEIRVVAGAPGTGVATAWFRMQKPVLPGVEPSPLQRAVGAADFANGLSFRVPFGEWIFVNTDLTVHLSREPVGEWIALDARTDLGDGGAGLAAGVLHDDDGRIGTVAQALFIQPR
ncbi:MAG: thioesterase family protein [Solirubrobacteraceae bacterium]|nr:thioesterase family protein [Solirubrobacteraceae bacterium]